MSSKSRRGDGTKSNQSIYQYQPLRQHNNEIRLLILQSAPNSSAPLQAELKHVALSNASFSALSYVWGQQKHHPSVLTVVSPQRRSVKSLFKSKSPAAEDDHVLVIGSNVADALRCLRHRHKTVTLWVDAICINQNDGLEKSWQVGMMADIYTRANGVSAWLGPSYGDDPDEPKPSTKPVQVAYGVCSEIWSLAQRVKEMQNLSHEEGWLEACFAAAGASTLTNREGAEVEQSAWIEFSGRLSNAVLRNASIMARLGSLQELSQLAWFSRIWILQESGRARDLQLYYGTSSESYKVLYLGLSVAQGISASSGASGSHIDLRGLDTRFHGCLTARATRRRTFQEVLEVAYLAPPPLYGATDPRDLIYARRGLAKDESSEAFSVAYEARWDVVNEHGENVKDEDLSKHDREQRDAQRHHITGRVFSRATRFLLEHGVLTTLVTFKPYEFLWKLPLECYESWAYDWSGKGLDTFQRYRAAGETRQRPTSMLRESVDDSSLRDFTGTAMCFTGVTLGEVQHVGKKFSAAVTQAGFQSQVIVNGTLQDAIGIAEPSQTRALIESIVANYRSLGLTVPDVKLQQLSRPHSYSLLSFFHWWTSWIAQLEALGNTGDSPSARRRLPDSVAELVLREVTGTEIGRAVTSAFGGAGTSLALLDLRRWWPLLFTANTNGQGDDLDHRPVSAEGLQVMDAMFRGAWGMRPALFEGGRLAYIPEDCDPLDEVVIFHGVKAPLVIRSSGEGIHQIIGPAHVASAMDGSMMEAGLSSRTYTII